VKSPPKPDDEREEIAKRSLHNDTRRRGLQIAAQAFETKLPEEKLELLRRLDETARDLRPDVPETVRNYHKSARAAFRADLSDHPLVREWASARRSLGEIKELRALKNIDLGLTHGSARQLSPETIWLLSIARDAVTGDASDRTDLKPSRLRRLAINRLRSDDWLPTWMFPMVEDRAALRAELRSRLGASRQAFEEWTRRIGVYEARNRRDAQ
jgi:hypothetical protein